MGQSAYNWEFSTSVQHELAPRLGIDVGYFRRWFGNFQVTQILGLTAADFDPYSVTAPLDTGLPDGGGYAIDGLYNLNPGKVGLGTNYTTLARDFGEQTEHWNGIDFSANARLQNGLLMQGGVSTGRTTTDNCDVLANSQGAVFTRNNSYGRKRRPEPAGAADCRRRRSSRKFEVPGNLQ